MVKRRLKQKISCVKWSALLFAVIYFAIGVILKSDGPKFDPDKTYELMRDSLTLTAYFLAPVAAFVLFSDWRQEHIEKKLDGIADKLIIDVSDIELYLWQAHYKAAISIIGYDIKLIEHPTKGSLFNMRKNLDNDISIVKDLKSNTSLLECQLASFSELTHKLEDKIKLLKCDDSHSDINEKISSKVRQKYMSDIDIGLKDIGDLKKEIFNSLTSIKIKSN